MTKRAERKKLQRHFKVGDVITWGTGAVNHTILEVTKAGVYVDVTDEADSRLWATRKVGDRYHLLVTWDRNNRSKSGRGPIRRVQPREA